MFKEAIQKMPRQFAPQSLYNMMGKSCICFRIESVKAVVFTEKRKKGTGEVKMHFLQLHITHFYFTWFYYITD